MIIAIPFDTDRHTIMQKTVRSRGKGGAAINVPKKFLGQECIILYALQEDDEETKKWRRAVFNHGRG